MIVSGKSGVRGQVRPAECGVPAPLVTGGLASRALALRIYVFAALLLMHAWQ